ncbi:hypothetical protein AB0A70_05805 [Streptomyces morookaense]|uniref:hypothetical protein n=1 Tax=Streptomyces morookaense TaxID=1970 RepID=UPI0033F87091
MQYRSLNALDALPVLAGAARRRQLSMVRLELLAALENGVLPTPARHSLDHLLDDRSLALYVSTAETGALRSRLVNGEKPPTAPATNIARLDCLDLLRRAAALPPFPRESLAPVELRPTPGQDRLTELRKWLGNEVQRHRSPGHSRFIALISVVLDTRARAGELVAQRIDHLAEDFSRLRVIRNPQHGTGSPPASEDIALSLLGQAALKKWLHVRAELTETLQGTASALWVSLSHNHAGTDGSDGHHTPRRAGMPLQQRGLIRSYNVGRLRYGLVHLLPPKLEQLRRAAQQIGNGMDASAAGEK